MDVNDDAQLLSRSRAGDAAAYAQLYERHVGTALHVARQMTDEAEDVVSDAFARTYTVLREGRGPDVAFRPYLLRAVRNAAIDRHRRVRRITPRESLEEAETPLHHAQPTADPAIDRLEQQLVAQAFQSLPERWQMVLWHTEVQGEAPAQVAPLLGISPRAVAQLAVRAREGLRTAWLQEHIVTAPPGHEEMVHLLAAHVRGSLGVRDRRALETHLTECVDCRRLRDELKDVNNRLRVILVPALLGLSIAKLAWGAPPAAAAAAVPVAGAAAVGTARDGVSGLAGGAAAGGAHGSGTAGAASAAAAGGTVSAPSAAGSTAGAGGLLAATVAAVSQPVTAGLVAAAVATTGFGAYVAIGSRPADPAPPGESRPAQVTPPSPGNSGPPSPSTGPTSGSPGPGATDSASPTGGGSPSPTTAPGSGTPDSTGPTPPPSTSGSVTATDPSTSGSSSASTGATSSGPTTGSSAPATPGSSAPSSTPGSPGSSSGPSPSSTSSPTSSSATPSATGPNTKTPPP
ncbi:sigma-70 family RNA polymerase sigma factor [Geodermatophilus pulveris]|uniref:sigma-70 family RNA polymerase sigma factor n=1 Tax=Geodermatophilus pulveris TaxID=1564159 RepID=UPI000B79A470|nr:sigma-70 family RNA polymerase sigma factor [Geodermatophilus pulveris]